MPRERCAPLTAVLAIISVSAILLACGTHTPTQPSQRETTAMPGSVGPIAFTSDRDGTDQIYLANADGSAVTRLTPGMSPAWTRDGQKVVYQDPSENIYIINVDGSGLHRVSAGASPNVSPDGRTIALQGIRGIDVIGVDGSNRRSLYDDHGFGSFDPVWSPDGGRIAFSVGTYVDDFTGLWMINADGSNARQIGFLTGAWRPAWSPDGAKIAYITWAGIGVVNGDGSGAHLQIPGGDFFDVDWSPDGGLVFTKPASGQTRIFIADGAGERQLIPDAAATARASYRDWQVAWRR